MSKEDGFFGLGILSGSKNAAKEKLRKCYKISWTWKERFAEALAKEIIAKGHFERRDLADLTTKIERMLTQYEREWG